MHTRPLTLIEGYRFTVRRRLRADTILRIALEQRIFGPRRLLVLRTSRDRIMVGLSHCIQTDPPELALKSCLSASEDESAAAIAFNDEPVTDEPPLDLRQRFGAARAAAADCGVWLVDWIACDGVSIRSTLATLNEPLDWPDRTSEGCIRPMHNRSP